MPGTSKNLLAGMVIASFGIETIIETETGDLLRATTRKKLGNLVSGDRVQYQTIHANNYAIEKREDRTTELARPDMRGRKKVIAANISQMLIVTACKPAFNPGLIDRYLVAAEMLKITPVILLNKTDLLTDEISEHIEPYLNDYRAIGYSVIYTSCKKAHGYDDLMQQLKQLICLISYFPLSIGLKASIKLTETLLSLHARCVLFPVYISRTSAGRSQCEEKLSRSKDLDLAIQKNLGRHLRMVQTS